MIKFSSILEKINVKSCKNMLKMGAILLWTDMKRLFNWNMGKFKSNFLSWVSLEAKVSDSINSHLFSKCDRAMSIFW